MREFRTRFKKMCTASAYLLNYGTKLALGVLIIGIFAYKWNQWYVGSYENEVFCISIVQSAFSMFFQFTAGALILDCVSRKK